MFGTRPESMPTLLEDRVLNRTVVASGPLSLAPADAGIILPQAVTIEPERTYLVEVVLPDGKLRIVPAMSPPGPYAAGQPLAISGTFNADPGANFKLVRMPRVPVRLVDVVGAGTAVLLMIVLDWLVFRTKTGRAMRAVSFNTRNAALMGIDVDRTVSITFVIGAALAAAAGFLFSQKYSGLNQTAASIWVLLGLKAFVAAVVGGIGNIRGAMPGRDSDRAPRVLRDGVRLDRAPRSLCLQPPHRRAAGEASGILGSTVREKV